MNSQQGNAPVLVQAILALFLFGVATLIWGRKLPRQGDWLIWLGMLGLLGAGGYDAGFFSPGGFQIQSWLVGWIWPRSDPGALTLGVYQDVIGLTMAVLAALVAAVVLLNHGLLSREARPARIYAGLGIATAGVGLAWVSYTPWLAFLGIGMTVFGGFIGPGSRWDSNPEAAVSSRFAWERGWGLLISFFGAVGVASAHPALTWAKDQVWTSQVVPELGAGLICIGLLIQFQPFPFVGWLMSESETPATVRVLLNQIFPGWAAFALLLRLEPQLRTIGLLSVLGWVSLASALLTLLPGLLHKKWKASLGAWLSGGLCVSLAAMAFAGPQSGLSILLGVSLGGLALSGAGAALVEGEVIHSATHRQRAKWASFVAFVAAAAGTGGLGFVGVIGGLKWTAQTLDQPISVIAFVLPFFGLTLLGWKVAWNISRSNTATEMSWLGVLSPFLLVLLALGAAWSGTATGGALPGNPDLIGPSLFQIFFPVVAGGPASPGLDDSTFISASSLYWGALFAGFITAYWTVGRREDRWQALSQALPRFSSFVVHGYGLDRAFTKAQGLLGRFGNASHWLIDLKVWNDWLPHGLSYGLKAGTGFVAGLDTRVSQQLSKGLRKTFEVPAKALQVIQTGDVRWYLFFGIGSGLVLLLHFLKG